MPAWQLRAKCGNRCGVSLTPRLDYDRWINTVSFATYGVGGVLEERTKLNKERRAAIWFRRQVGVKRSLSRLGGLPALPADLAWPRHGESGAPLHFLAQVDLSRLPPTPFDGAANAASLPNSGLLFFFADMVEEMLWNENGGPFATTRVIFADGAGPERRPPEDIPEILHAYGEKAGGYETGMTVYPHAGLEPHVIDTFGGLQPYPDPSDAYAAAAQTALITSIERAMGPLPVFSGPGSFAALEAAKPREYVHELQFRDGAERRELHCPLHQMLGAGRNIQGTAESLHADGAILLMQIDSDRAVHDEFMFCDGGAAQFWIKPPDLAQRRFGKAWATTEGG